MSSLLAENLSIQLGEKRLCTGLNLALKPGEMWGVLGSNGIGKSVIFHTITAHNPHFSGKILINNVDFSRLTRKKIAQFLGILFQETRMIFPQTVWDYCLAARFPHRHYFEKYSPEDVAITEKILRACELLPHQKKCVTTLSGGEKRRVAIAALLIQSPAIYILDEPANHLDLRYKMHILTHFRQLVDQEKKAVMMSLHDVNDAQQFCDHVLLLFPDGTHKLGYTKDLLHEENLNTLYQIPFQKITHAGKVYWQAHSSKFDTAPYDGL